MIFKTQTTNSVKEYTQPVLRISETGYKKPTLLDIFYLRTTELLRKTHKKLFSCFSRNDYELKVFVNETGKAPTKGRPQDAGFDFYVDLQSKDSADSPLMLEPGTVQKLSTGCFCEFPPETAWFWDVRSSVGIKGLDVTCRTIDNGYRGELSLVLVNNSKSPVWIHQHSRVAQLIPNPFSSKYKLKLVQSKDELKKSDRGEKGFGSSGSF